MKQLIELFIAFLQVGLFSIGGGYSAIPIIQSKAIDATGWLTLNEFSDLITIAEMTPGPIAVNSATFVGNRVASIPGGIAATLGCIFPACIICSILAFVYYKYKTVSAISTIMSFLRPVVVALITASGVNIFLNAAAGAKGINMVGIVLAAAAFYLLRSTKLSPILIMILTGVFYTLFHLI